MKVSVEMSLHRIGEHLEIGGAARNVDMRREAEGLAGVEAFGREEFVEAGVDLVGDRGQHVGALGDGHLPPGTVERRLGGLHGGVDLGLAAFRHAADQAVVERRKIVPALARRPLRENAVDEMSGVATRAVDADPRLFVQSLNRHARLLSSTILISQEISPKRNLLDLICHQLCR